MSTAGQLSQQLHQDLQNELITSNQLLCLISQELQQIKQFTSPGSGFESNIQQNASLMTTLASMQQLDLENMLPMARIAIDISHHSNQNMSYEQHETFRDISNIDDSK